MFTDMKTIINYTTGGLGNRLKPLCSAYNIAKQTDRKLLVYWDSMEPCICPAHFTDLFDNSVLEIAFITPEEIVELESAKILSVLMVNTFYTTIGLKDNVMKFLSGKFVISSGFDDILNNPENNLIIHSNNFIPGVSGYEFLDSLIPVRTIRDKVALFTKDLRLDKTVIGVHARGTDFAPRTTPHYFINMMLPHLENNPKVKFFVSTEDKSFEQAIYNAYPDNVVFRTKKNYVIKTPVHENTVDHMIEAVEDMFLLSKTDIRIYHPDSTFAEIARLL